MKILDCGLSLANQKLYIQRLKKMLDRYEVENLKKHCPITKRFNGLAWLTTLGKFNQKKICDFCMVNVDATNCPCLCLDPEEAADRGKKFIALFEAEHGEV